MPDEMYSTIRAIEAEAEDLIAQAKAKARQILEDAKKQSKAITAEDFPSEEIESEREKIIREAHERSLELIEKAKQKTTELKQRFDTQSDEVVKIILQRVKGQS
jgi:F0F1-type ATP synthase membrane subunit b/b'